MIEMQEAVDVALAASSADACIVIAEQTSETNLRWANNGLTTNGQTASRSVNVISLVTSSAGTAVGSVSRSVTGTGGVHDLVRASEQAARTAAPADDVMPLIEPYPTDDDWTAPAAATSVEVFGPMTDALGGLLRAAERSGRALFGFAEHQVTSTFLASSSGLRRRFDQPTGRLELNAKTGDYAQSAWDGVTTRDFVDLDIAALIDGLHRRLDWSSTTMSLEPGRYETLLPPCATADLMLSLYWATSARDAEEGRSVFAAPGGTRIGDQLSPLPLTMYSDPGQAAVACAPFEIASTSFGGVQSVFDNGAPLGRTDWITDGVLTNLARSRSWAAKTGTEPRMFLGNLVVDAGSHASLADMIASTERGLLLTTLWYIRTVDPQTLLETGLTRDGVYLIEEGAVRGAVNNFRFNESPVDLLRRVSEVGRSEPTLPREWGDYFTRVIMPPLRIPDFNMSTVSAAS